MEFGGVSSGDARVDSSKKRVNVKSSPNWNNDLVKIGEATYFYTKYERVALGAGLAEPDLCSRHGRPKFSLDAAIGIVT